MIGERPFSFAMQAATAVLASVTACAAAGTTPKMVATILIDDLGSYVSRVPSSTE